MLLLQLLFFFFLLLSLLLLAWLLAEFLLLPVTLRQDQLPHFALYTGSARSANRLLLLLLLQPKLVPLLQQQQQLLLLQKLVLLLTATATAAATAAAASIGGVVAVVSRGVSTQSTPHACPASHAACTCRSTSTTRETSVRLCGLDEQRTLAAQLLGPSLLHLIKASATTKREGPEMFGRTSPVALEGSRGTDNIS